VGKTYRKRRHAIAVALGCLVWFGERGKDAQAVGGPPVPQGGQTVKPNANGQAEQQKEAAPKPTWPPSITAAEEASRAECATEEDCRTQHREYSDLRAQWQAADAAKGQEALALTQTVIAGLATALAGWGTVYLIRLSKKLRDPPTPLWKQPRLPMRV
jgi:hypothetical protein